MISFPILNSLKFNTSVSTISNYRNTLYQNLDRGVNQETAIYTDVCVVFKNYDTLYIQIEISDDWSASDVDIKVNKKVGGYVDYGDVNTPTNGATSTLVASTDDSDIYLITIPLLNTFSSDTCYVSFVNSEEDEEYFSEYFYVYNVFFDKDITRDILKIEYSNLDGLKNGYYWSGETQTIKLDVSYYTGAKFDRKAEETETLRGETLVLEGYSLRVDTYNKFNLPFYIYEKLNAIRNQLYITVNDVEMTISDISDPTGERNGAVDFTISFKEKNTATHY